jgi:hypothetical protein
MQKALNKMTLLRALLPVSLTSDISNGRAKQDYISVVVHYVKEKLGITEKIHE